MQPRCEELPTQRRTRRIRAARTCASWPDEPGARPFQPRLLAERRHGVRYRSFQSVCRLGFSGFICTVKTLLLLFFRYIILFYSCKLNSFTFFVTIILDKLSGQLGCTYNSHNCTALHHVPEIYDTRVLVHTEFQNWPKIGKGMQIPGIQLMAGKKKSMTSYRFQILGGRTTD